MRLKIELYEPVGGAGLTTTFIVEECDQWEVLDSGCLSLIEHKGYDIGAPRKICSALAWKSVERIVNGS